MSVTKKYVEQQAYKNPILSYADGLEKTSAFSIILCDKIENIARLPYNENDLWHIYADLKHIAENDCWRHALTAKTIELAVYLAGNYADACEFTFAGDLLLNPAEVDVHIRGSNIPLRKPRHMEISKFVAGIHGIDPKEAENPHWLSQNTFPVIRKKCIIETLRDDMTASGVFTETYMNHINRRIKKVSETIAFLMAWQIETIEDLTRKTAFLSISEKEFIKENMCCFDLSFFHSLCIGSNERKSEITSRYFFKTGNNGLHSALNNSDLKRLVSESERRLIET